MSNLVLRAASGDLGAVEEIRAVLSEGPRDVVLWSGKTDRRRRASPDDTSISADDLTIKVIVAWLRANGAATSMTSGPVYTPRLPAFELRVVEVDAAKGWGLRLPWRHGGRRHPGVPQA